MTPLAWGAAVGLLGGALMRAWIARGGHRRAGEVGACTVSLWVVVVASTLATAVVAYRAPGPLAVAAALYTVAAVGLSWVDLDVRRVPDAVLAGLAPLLAVAVVAAALVEGSPAVLARAGIGAAAMGGLYLVAAVAGSMGAGDVKFAAVSGMVLGAVDLRVVVVATVLGFVIGAVAALALLVTARAGRSDHLAFAPALCAGAVVALAL